jgi:flagellar hook-length control protein FliK
MRTETFDMIPPPKAKPSPAALRPGGDVFRGGAPAEARQGRERFELPDEAQQTRQPRQDPAETRRADARADDMRRDQVRRNAVQQNERREDERVGNDRAIARRRDDTGQSRGLGRDNAPGQQVMRDVHERRGVDPQAQGPKVSPEEVASETALPDPALADAAMLKLLGQGAEGKAVDASGEVGSEPADLLADADAPSGDATDAQDDAGLPQPESNAVDAGLDEGSETSVADISAVAPEDTEAATAVNAPVGLLMVKPEPGMSEAGRARRLDGMAARSGVANAAMNGAAGTGVKGGAVPAQASEASSPSIAPVFIEREMDAPEVETSADVTGEGDGAAVLDNPGLRRALGQLGLATPGQNAPGQGAPVQAAAPLAGQAHAHAVIGELAQAHPSASQQGLAQALAGLAEVGKAGPGAPPATVPTAPVVPNVPLGAVPIEIGLKALAGVNHFQIRLDPAELGRIDVRLEIETDGTIKAKLTVDRVETLSLLQRDARTLERAFEQAGLKPSDTGVDLSLRDQDHNDRRGEPERGYRDEAPAHGRKGGQGGEGEAKPLAPTIVERTIWRGAAGIDVRI